VVERLDLDAPDAPSNLGCGEGTPGVVWSVP
jgi:hypothetical protein